MPRQRTRAGEAGTVHTKKIDDKKWEAHARVRDYTGQIQRLRRYGPTKTAALRAMKQAIEKHTGTAGISADTAFKVIAESYRSEFREKVEAEERSPSSLVAYNGTLDNHILPALGDLSIHEAASAVRLNRFVQKCRRDNGVATARKVRLVLNGVMTHAVTNGAIKSNPMRDVARIEGEARKKKPRALSSAERDAWWVAVDANEKARQRDLPDVCRFLMATGCRIGEAAAVTFGDINFDDGTADIKYTVIYVPRVGLRRVPTKTRSSERELHLPTWCMQLLKRRSNHYGGVGPVFPSALTGGWRHPTTIQWGIRQLTEEIIADKKIAIDLTWMTTHTFRKTVATELFDLGMNARAVADQMGHSMISMTQDSYLGRSSTSSRHASLLERLNPGGDESGQ